MLIPDWGVRDVHPETSWGTLGVHYKSTNESRTDIQGFKSPGKELPNQDDQEPLHHQIKSAVLVILMVPNTDIFVHIFVCRREQFRHHPVQIIIMEHVVGEKE